MLESTPNGDALGHDPWQLVERTPDAQRAALHETLFGLGNGRIGLRGAHEEGACWPGTADDAIFLNGFHDTEAIQYPEQAHGLARENQFVVAVPNGKAIAWSIEDEAFDPTRGRIEDYRRRFDFRTGRLGREFVWISPRGRHVAVRSERLVCLARAPIYAIEYELRVLDSAARITLESSIDARAPAADSSDRARADPRAGRAHGRERMGLERIGLDRTTERILLTHRTRRSHLQLVSAALQQLEAGGRGVGAHACGEADHPGLRYEIELRADERVVLTKYCALVSTLDHPATELAALASEELARARAAGFQALCDEQQAFLARHWHDSDVEIDGDAALQQGLRFNLLQLLQSVGRDGRTLVAARGIGGRGRDGHYVGDTEVYVFPVMLHTQPATARKLLEYRHGRLDAARARARELSHARGALFPWRTIDGAECSAYFPASTAQVHANADLALAVKRYWEATGDDAFMLDGGAELVIETARIWIGLGHFEPSHDADDPPRRFSIHGVTGPDDYNALVNNNLYTNAMARMHLRFAIDIVRWLGNHHADALQRIAQAIDFDPSEPTLWQQAAARMYIPYERARGIHPQDDSFLSKPRWEVSGLDLSKRPLMHHHHPLVIYRHQVCKQADVLLALLLLDDEFYPADKRRNFDYYEPLTVHDSALSRCVFGIVASEVGCPDKAYRYFVDTVRTDLDDHHGNTHDGVHTAAMAGSWLGVVAGFAGLRVHRGVPSFAPTLPRAWTRYAFKLRIGDAQLRLSVDQHGSHYRLLEGRSLALQHHGQAVVLNADQPLSIFAA